MGYEMGSQSRDERQMTRHRAIDHRFINPSSSRVKNSSGGTRTHSIPGSKPRWSADCLPSHVFIDAQGGIRTRRHSGLSRAAQPIGVPGRFIKVVLGGLEPPLFFL
jgi:hypothetical protein